MFNQKRHSRTIVHKRIYFVHELVRFRVEWRKAVPPTIYSGVCVGFSTEKKKTIGPSVSSAAFIWRFIVFHVQWSINKSKGLRKSVFVTDRRSRGTPVCMCVGHSGCPFISIYFRLVSPSRLFPPYLSVFLFYFFFPSPTPRNDTTDDDNDDDWRTPGNRSGLPVLYSFC